METFKSNGKLLLTGEYAVLDGALSMALPTTLGQTLTVEYNNSAMISWKSFDEFGNIWYESNIDIEILLSDKAHTLKDNISERLIQILRVVFLLSPKVKKLKTGASISTALEFNKNWGLGSSSTLINNLATWAEIDPYVLLDATFGGSGYDIACARSNGPLLYQLSNSTRPNIAPIVFNPCFTEHLYFVYLNKKQNSREGIANYKKYNKVKTSIIERISTITKEISQCKNLQEFNRLLEEHEQIISELILQKPIKMQLFNDFDGTIKSLGAWGGDFILATSMDNPELYFKSKGLETVIPYSKLVL